MRRLTLGLALSLRCERAASLEGSAGWVLGGFLDKTILEAIEVEAAADRTRAFQPHSRSDLL